MVEKLKRRGVEYTLDGDFLYIQGPGDKEDLIRKQFTPFEKGELLYFRDLVFCKREMTPGIEKSCAVTLRNGMFFSVLYGSFGEKENVYEIFIRKNGGDCQDLNDITGDDMIRVDTTKEVNDLLKDAQHLDRNGHLVGEPSRTFQRLFEAGKLPCRDLRDPQTGLLMGDRIFKHRVKKYKEDPESYKARQAMLKRRHPERQISGTAWVDHLVEEREKEGKTEPLIPKVARRMIHEIAKRKREM